MKEFEFKHVVTFKFIWFVLLGLLVGFPIIILYGAYGFKYFGVMGLILCGFIMMSLLFFIPFCIKKY